VTPVVGATDPKKSQRHFHVIQEPARTKIARRCYPGVCGAIGTQTSIIRGTMQMKSFTTLVAGTAPSVLMLNGFALAQQQPEQMPQLTNDE
jgi:hypothetical protein